MRNRFTKRGYNHKSILAGINKARNNPKEDLLGQRWKGKKEKWTRIITRFGPHWKQLSVFIEKTLASLNYRWESEGGCGLILLVAKWVPILKDQLVHNKCIPRLNDTQLNKNPLLGMYRFGHYFVCEYVEKDFYRGLL